MAIDDIRTPKTLTLPSPEDIETPIVKDVFKKLFSNQDGMHKKLFEDLTTLWRILAGLDAMNNALNMGTHKINNVVDPAAAQDAATKNYVDTAGSEFRSGDQMISSLTSAPTGWTDVSATYNNKFIRVSSGTPLDVAGADTHTHAAGTYASPTSGSHTLSIAEMPAHDHSYNAAVGSRKDGGGPVTVAVASASTTGQTGGDGGHTHTGGTITGTSAAGDNVPAYVQIRIFQKD